MEASADLLQGLLESLETEAWLPAQPALSLQPATGPNGGPLGARLGALPGGGACTLAPSRDQPERGELWVPW